MTHESTIDQTARLQLLPELPATQSGPYVETQIIVTDDTAGFLAQGYKARVYTGARLTAFVSKSMLQYGSREDVGADPPVLLLKVNQDVRHIFVTGHSGAGKSTYAKRLSTETGLPVHRLDDAPGLLAARKLGDTPTAERLSREAVAHSLTLATPHIIEGTSALLAPEHMAGHRVVLMDAPREDILNARLQREVAQAAVRGVGEDVARRQAHGANIYDYYAPRVDALRQLPNVEVRAPGYVPTVNAEDSHDIARFDGAPC